MSAETDSHLKMLELTSEFSFEKCQDIIDTMIDFHEAVGNWDDVTFWINVGK